MEPQLFCKGSRPCPYLALQQWEHGWRCVHRPKLHVLQRLCWNATGVTAVLLLELHALLMLRSTLQRCTNSSLSWIHPHSRYALLAPVWHWASAL